MEDENASNRKSKTVDKIRKSLIDGSAPTAESPRKRRSDIKITSISGSNNVVGDGNSVNIYNHSPIEKKIVIVKTGDGVLDAAQKAQINALIDKWIEARGAVRRSKAEISSLRYAFNKAMKVSSYAEIRQEDFDKAIKWIRRQIAIVTSMHSAPARMPKWRNQRYASINARAKEFPNGEMRYREYAQKKFATGSLAELSDEQLEAVRKYVYGWRRKE